MKRTLYRLSSRFSLILSSVLHQARHRADQARLANHILEINKKGTSVEIISAAAQCLKEILGYRMFGFVIKSDQTADVWLDPAIYRQPLEKMIRRDFELTGENAVCFMNHPVSDKVSVYHFDPKDLVMYDTSHEEIVFRVYMLPMDPSPGHHDEIVGIILQAAAYALTRQFKIEDLTDAAVIDPLTGCYNRRELENQIRRLAAGASRHKSALSLFMFDLDHFKKINDNYGHLAGDEVLRQVSRLVRANMRKGDVLARYGGEEFVALLPETRKEKAMELADRLREKISNMVISHEGRSIRVTSSFGVAQFNHQADMTMLIQEADTMLYRAKMNGRNTVMPGVIKVVSPSPGRRKNRL